MHMHIEPSYINYLRPLPHYPRHHGPDAELFHAIYNLNIGEHILVYPPLVNKEYKIAVHSNLLAYIRSRMIYMRSKCKACSIPIATKLEPIRHPLDHGYHIKIARLS